MSRSRSKEVAIIWLVSCLFLSSYPISFLSLRMLTRIIGSRCHQNFCWECLAPLTHRDVHAEGCSHRLPIVQDGENFVAENLTVREVNRLIDDARRRREGGA